MKCGAHLTVSALSFLVAAGLCVRLWALPRTVMDLSVSDPRVLDIGVPWVNMAAPSYIGDVDGDGRDDVFYLARHFDESNSVEQIGNGMIVYGFARPRGRPRIALEALSRTRIVPDPEYMMPSSLPARPLGDVDGDGFDDFLIAMKWRTIGGRERAGEVLVVYGERTRQQAISLRSLSEESSRAVRIRWNDDVGSLLGRNVGRVGDFDSDGRQEALVVANAPGALDGMDGGNMAFVIPGRVLAERRHLALEGIGSTFDGFALQGLRGRDLLGGIRPQESIAPNTDIDGDGFEDLIIPVARTEQGLQHGAMYLIYGGQSLSGFQTIETLDVDCTVLRGPSGRFLQFRRLAALGDFDGDGVDDICVASDSSSEAYLILGSPRLREMREVAVDSPEVRTVHFFSDYVPPFLGGFSAFSRGFDGAGDWNGDGFADVLFGAYRQSVGVGTDVGRAYLVFGGSKGLGGGSYPDSAIGTVSVPGMVIQGPEAQLNFGRTVDSRGDIDGDGHRDILISTWFQHRESIERPSSIYVLWGGAEVESGPWVGGVTPSRWSVEGDERVNFRGRGFDGTERVLFDGVEASDVEVESTALLHCTIPEGRSVGPVEVKVSNSKGEFRSSELFSYAPPPVIPDIELSEASLSAKGFEFLIYEDFPIEVPPGGGNAVGVAFHDLSDDGIDDLIIRTQTAGTIDLTGLGTGRITVLRGRAGAEESLPRYLLDGDTLEGDEGAIIRTGVPDFALFGFSMDFPGDLDGDGLEELLTSAIPLPAGFGASSLGVPLVVYGRDPWTGTIILEDELAAGGAEELAGEWCGPPVIRSLGDFNRDGIADLGFGFGGGCSGTQSPYQLLLSQDEEDRPLAHTAVTVVGSAGSIGESHLGTHHAGGLDFNGDAWPDFVVGADGSGDVYVVFGGEPGLLPSGASIDDYVADGRALRLTRSMSNLGPRVQQSVVDLGDFDGDGLSDIAVGIPSGGRDFHGEAHVVYGRRDWSEFGAEVDLLNAPTGFSTNIEGPYAYDWNGHVQSIGDISGDGLADLGIVGENHRKQPYRAYVVYGLRSRPAEIDLLSREFDGFVLTTPDESAPEGESRFTGGRRGMASGDFNGNGIMDLAVGVVTRNTGRRAVLIYDIARPAEASFLRGDANEDTAIDASDSIAILSHMFLGDPAPDCVDRLDVDDNGTLELTDPIYLLAHLFLGGEAPPPPFDAPGIDPTRDELPCPVPDAGERR